MRGYSPEGERVERVKRRKKVFMIKDTSDQKLSLRTGEKKRNCI